MLYSRDNICEIHTVHTVEANSAEEAAEKFRSEMTEAVDNAYTDNKVPFYLKDKDYLPEIWNDKLHFFDENGKEYDSSGKEIPSFPEEESDENLEESTNSYFVWGIKASDDLSFGDVCADTMNDIDVMFEDGEYVLSIEEIYLFDREVDRIAYLNALCDKFRDFVLSKGYTETEVDNLKNCMCFSHYYPSAVFADISDWKSATLIDLYRKFKLFVIGFTAITNSCV